MRTAVGAKVCRRLQINKIKQSSLISLNVVHISSWVWDLWFNVIKIQESIASSHGSQCGFCTPGFVMSMYTLLRTNSEPTSLQMEAAFQGKLDNVIIMQCLCKHIHSEHIIIMHVWNSLLFVTWTVCTLLNADSNRTFLPCVLMIDSVMPFRSGFAHGGH